MSLLEVSIKIIKLKLLVMAERTEIRSSRLLLVSLIIIIIVVKLHPVHVLEKETVYEK